MSDWTRHQGKAVLIGLAIVMGMWALAELGPLDFGDRYTSSAEFLESWQDDADPTAASGASSADLASASTPPAVPATGGLKNLNHHSVGASGSPQSQQPGQQQQQQREAGSGLRPPLLLASPPPVVVPMPKGDNVVMQEVEARRDWLWEKCEIDFGLEHNPAAMVRDTRGSLFYYPDIHVMWTSVPKSMSSSIKLTFAAMEGHGLDWISYTPRWSSRPEVLDAHGKTVSDDEFFTHTTRVVFGRNPYTRLYSAWKDKFRSFASIMCDPETGKCAAPMKQWIKYAGQILAGEGLEYASLTQYERLNAVTWERFRSAVLDKGLADAHWREQGSRACAIAPTFVGKQETGGRDLRALVHYLGVHLYGNSSTFEYAIPPRWSAAQIAVQAHVSTPVDYTGLYGKDDEEKMATMYWKDFYVFNYSTRAVDA